MNEFTAPTIEYVEMLPLLIVGGAACLGVLIEAFLPRRHRFVVQAGYSAATLAAALAAKRTVMGFGHRVYKHGDSRVPLMQSALDDLVRVTGTPEAERLSALHTALREAMTARTGIHPNLDYPAGLAYHLMGFDIPVFTPIFVLSRITGWTAHIVEQLERNIDMLVDMNHPRRGTAADVRETPTAVAFPESRTASPRRRTT
jgi:hypothetical protein